MVDVTLELATVADAEMLTQTCKRAFESDAEFGAPGPGGPPGYDSVKWNLERIRNRYLQYYKILIGEEIVGGFIAGDRGPGYRVCERIWVDPGYMQKGIGTRTFEIVWKKYPSADLWALGTPEWNTRSNPFYQSLGFKQIGITRDYPSWNGIFYEKRITENRPRALVDIRDLREDMSRLVVEGEVQRVSLPRTVTSRRTGEDLTVADAILADETGLIKLVLWNDQIRQVDKDSRIRIENGHVKAFKEELQLGISTWGMIITLQS
jgi:GNAT superfamily N-acetyltransferase